MGENVRLRESALLMNDEYSFSTEIRRSNPNYEAPGLLDDRNPRQRNRPRNRLKNIQNTDAMDGDVSPRG